MDLTELLKKHLFTSRSLSPAHFRLTLHIFLGESAHGAGSVAAFNGIFPPTESLSATLHLTRSRACHRAAPIKAIDKTSFIFLSQVLNFNT